MRSATPRERDLLRKALSKWSRYRLANGIPKRRGLRPRNFDHEQLAIGAKVELEHTKDPAVALEIAMAHLAERRDYYARLAKIENRNRRR